MIRRPQKSPLFPNPTLSRPDPAGMDALFAEHRPEAVIHFAGLKSVGESAEKPLWYYRTKIGRAHRLNSSHANISYAVFCLKKKKNTTYHNSIPSLSIRL